MKNLYLIVSISILAIIGAGYLFAVEIESAIDSKPGLDIQVTVEDDVITNITMEQIHLPIYYKSSSGKVEFPDISANARLNDIMAPPISYWTSSPYNGDGIYKMTLVFLNATPATNDTLLIPIRITDMRGHIFLKQTAFYGWE